MSISKLYECMEIKNVNNSQAREAIYSLLMEVNDCMSVAEITTELAKVYPRKVSLNTIYRHLTLFTECGLVMVIQDDHKKAYYCLAGEYSKAFGICPKCNYLTQIKGVEVVDALLSTLDSTEFITVHKKCDNCK